MPSACILGCSGLILTAEERVLIADTNPWGFILYGRNIESPGQVRALTQALRDAVGRPDAPVFTDQEGGRVQRLGPPHWPRYPAAAAYAGQDPEIVRMASRLMACDLFEAGIDVTCAPVLDLRQSGASEVVGDRSFSAEPAEVASLGRAWIEGLVAGGVLPVIKHAPGHGRAAVDSHHARPTVGASVAELVASDFVPFAALADAPMAMTAHVVFEAIDPGSPATTSARVISDVVRGRLGFDGLLLSDDLGMAALAGELDDRARRARAAGCDVVLYGERDEAGRRAVAAGAGSMTGLAAGRARRALAQRRAPEPFDRDAARTRLSAAFGGSWGS